MNNPQTNPVSLFFNAISNNYTGIIAIILVITICYLWINEKSVPSELVNIVLVVISYLFGKNTSKNDE